jgi:hypothetical protein
MSNIIITNAKVIEFYNKYSFDPEEINLLFINLLTEIFENKDSTFNKSLGNHLMEKLSFLDNKIETINKSLRDDKKELSTCFLLQFNEYRNKYIEDMKGILSSNQTQYLSPFFREMNDKLLYKTQLILNEVLPKNQEGIMQQFQLSLSKETQKLCDSALTKDSLNTCMANIQHILQSQENNLQQVLQNQEKRIESRFFENDRKLTELKELNCASQTSQVVVQTNVSEILKKFEKSTTKGNVSENILYNILLSLFPCAEIEYVGNEQKETGDIILTRKDKPKILIENKDHDSKNIPKIDIDKFIRDCEIQNCSGIMLAQNRGIANKENFELQIHKTNVLLYVHEVKFDQDKIKMAVEIVEHFKQQLDVLNKKENNAVIQNEVLELINKEYIAYANQKNTMSKLLKDYNERMCSCLADLKLPTLDTYLSKHFAKSFQQNDNVCKYCEKVVLKSMKQHFRYCASKKEFDQQTESD